MVDDQEEEHKPGLEVELDYMTERLIPVMPPAPKLPWGVDKVWKNTMSVCVCVCGWFKSFAYFHNAVYSLHIKEKETELSLTNKFYPFPL